MVVRKKKAARGFTMVELLVTMSIIVILAALAVPAMGRLGLFSRGDLQNTSRELYNLLTAARVYATTYHVDTAVAYNLDLDEPYSFQDSATREAPLYALAAATMLYKPQQGSLFVPAPNSGGFTAFPGRCVVLLRDPDISPRRDTADNCELSPHMPLNLSGDDPCRGMRFAGLSPIDVDTELIDMTSTNGTLRLPAHVFTRLGQFVVLNEAGAKITGLQRYRFLITASLDDLPQDRLNDPDVFNLVQSDGTSNLRAIEIALYTATGRVKIAP